MRKAIMAMATAATVGFTTLATTSPAEAIGEVGRGAGVPGLAAGLIGAAVIGGIASSAYAYGPGYGYPGYGYLATRATVTVAVTMAGATRQPITATGTPRHITAGIRRATTPRPTILATAGSFVPPSLTTGVLVTTVGTIAGIVGNSRLAFVWVFGGRFRAAPLF